MTDNFSVSEDSSSIFNLLPPAIYTGLIAQGISKPTPVQQECYKPILEGLDVIAQSRTGSGKTLAFGLPAFVKLGSHKSSQPRLLVLTPTRELAQQVSDVFEVNFKPQGFRTLAITGGKSYRYQTSSLQRGVDAVVATPGRLGDLLNQGALNLEDVEILVLDEMDEMLDFGFADDILKIKKAIGKKTQTLLFSATFPPKVSHMARQMVANPFEVKVANTDKSTGHIEHGFVEIKSGRNMDALLGLLLYHDPEHALIFCKTREETKNIHYNLMTKGFSVGVLNGDMAQNDRTQTLDRFRNRSLRILVATDVAARGIDVTGLSHVINYTVPNNPETYTHRAGRTGRAGATGQAWTLISYNERREFQFICSKAKIAPTRIELPNSKKIVEQFLKNILSNMSDKSTATQDNMTHAAVDQIISQLDVEKTKEILSNLLKSEVSKQIGKIIHIDELSPAVKTEFGPHAETRSWQSKSSQPPRFGGGGYGGGGRSRDGRSSSGGGYSGGFSRKSGGGNGNSFAAKRYGTGTGRGRGA